LQRNIICDSSALISLSDTCNIWVLKFLAGQGIKFFITPAVKLEIVARPLAIRKYAFSAVRLQKNILDGTLELITSNSLHGRTAQVMGAANNLLSAGRKPLALIQDGEAECLAIFSSASAHALLIDEKTTRLLVENPQRLRESIEAEHDEKISENRERLAQLSEITRGITCMRSCELLAYAYNKGFFDEYGQKKQEAFRAAIYSLREAGCGMTSAEIAEYEKMDF
jgi:hypothetical protein